jgi:DNA-binding MarR family transcriptional regulator
MIQVAVETDTDVARTASELRLVLGQLIRRLRSEHRFPLAHAAVLGRLDREGPQSVSDLAAGERVRPQSMAQTVTDMEAERLLHRRPDPDDRRRAIVELTAEGRNELEQDRRRRVGWLADAIAADFSDGERELLAVAVPLLRRLAESEGR